MKEHSAKNIAAFVRARLYNLNQACGLEDVTKKEQWAAFLRKSHLSAPPFADVLSE